uniref:LEM domain-containing protein n=1 Tax=Anopheles culicifacies TaxID=139723 RepID=A0A182MK58_9DIPT
MRLSWSFLRLVLIAWVLVAGSFLLEQATGEQADDIARSLGVSDVNDWDIRSLYRVRFQHVTKRPPPGQRAAERKSKLASRWAALRERISELFPSRHTNPRTVVTFDKIATDFVNVGIVKLAKALDPPKTTPKSRSGKKAKLSSSSEPRPDVNVADVEDVTSPTKPARSDVRPKRRVTLLVDLPDFDLQDFDGFVEEESNLGEEKAESERSKAVPKLSERSSAHEPLPEPPQRLVADSPCAGSTAVVQGDAVSKFLLLLATTIVSLLVASRM